MSKIYFTSLDTDFAKALAALAEQQGDQVVTEPGPGIEFFIDTTDAVVAGDDKKVGEGVDMDAAVLAYHKNVSEPLQKLESVLLWMVGKKRICVVNSARASINWSCETAGFGRNMSKAAMNLILCLTKNGLIPRGFTFRIFDPLAGQVAPEQAARTAYGYFTRDRFRDDPEDGIGRQDEQNVIVRDALGRELPW